MPGLAASAAVMTLSVCAPCCLASGFSVWHQGDREKTEAASHDSSLHSLPEPPTRAEVVFYTTPCSSFKPQVTSCFSSTDIWAPRGVPARSLTQVLSGCSFKLQCRSRNVLQRCNEGRTPSRRSGCNFVVLFCV